MTREEAIRIGKTRQECLKAQKDGRCKCNLIPNFCNKGCEYNTSDKEYDEFETLAIKSLEAWEKVKKEMDETISTCESNTMRSTWCDGELAGFLQSKDIIDRNLSEVSE